MTLTELQVSLKPFQLLMEWVNKKGECGEGVCLLYQTDRLYQSARCLGPPWCHQIAFDRSVTSLGREGQDMMAVSATTATVAVG